MASLTLADYAKMFAQKKDALGLGVVHAFRQSPVLDMLTFTDTGSLSIHFMRAKSFPTPAFRQIGSSYSSSKGDFRPQEDRIYALGQNIEVDKALVRMRDAMVNDPRAANRELALEAMNRTFHYYFINGDPTTDEDGLTGLWYRLQNNLPSSQQVDAAQLDISTVPTTTTIVDTFLDYLEQLIDACNEGDVDALLMDRTTKLRMEAIFRKSGLLSTTTDQLGRRFATYGEGGPKLVTMGSHRDETDLAAGTKVIGHDEAQDGSTLSSGDYCTSIYAVKFGKDHLGGAQEYALEVDDKGLLEDGVTYRDVIDWPLGIYLARPRSVARMYGLIATNTEVSA